jgi:hypothetical protein
VTHLMVHGEVRERNDMKVVFVRTCSGDSNFSGDEEIAW